MHAVLEELARRGAAIAAVDAVLESAFRFGVGRRLKRGVVHRKIAVRLGVRLNNALCRLVRERVEAHGARPQLSRGNLYYLGIFEVSDGRP